METLYFTESPVNGGKYVRAFENKECDGRPFRFWDSRLVTTPKRGVKTVILDGEEFRAVWVKKKAGE
jgi:hypothetical protein